MFPNENKVVIDYETTGLNPYLGDRPFIVGMEDNKGHLLFARPGTREWRQAQDIIENPKIEKIAHGAKFELKMSKHMGMRPAGKWHDTMALSVLVNEYQPINLADLSRTMFKTDYKGSAQAWLKHNKRVFTQEYSREPNYSDIPDEILLPYLEGDLDSTIKLFAMWHGPVTRAFKYLYDLETELAWRIVEMEDRGIHVDLPYCERTIGELRKLQDKLEVEIYEAAGCRFNLASPKQMGQVLVALGAAEYDDEGKVDTSYDTLKLKVSKHPFISSLITWRTLAKMLDTYLVPFTQKALGGVLHPSFWQYGKDKAIVTGRFSATDPNMQNIPKGIRGDKDALHKLGDVVRRAVIPRAGHALMFFDYKQIEMAIFTCLTGDIDLIAAIRRGEDIYTANALRFYGPKAFEGMDKMAKKKMRYDVKEICLSLIYGMGVHHLAAKLGKPFSEARFHKNNYFAKMPKSRAFILGTQAKLLADGAVKDVFGRNYHVPINMAYKAINALCQGSAATIMKRAILKSPVLKEYGVYPIITVHDELICEVPIENIDTAAKQGRALFEELTIFPAPLRVDVEVSQTNWADKRPYEFK